MKKVICALSLLLLLSACGKEEEYRQIAALQEKNAAYEEKIAALTSENASLRNQLEEIEKDREEADPITAFYDAVEYDGSTISMNIVANSRADAWEAETRHLAGELKTQLPLREDRDLVDAYLRSVEEQVERMDIMAIYSVSDVSVPHSERLNSAGTLRGVLWAGSRSALWHSAFEMLLCSLPEGPDYTYLFDAARAQTELDEALS